MHYPIYQEVEQEDGLLITTYHKEINKVMMDEKGREPLPSDSGGGSNYNICTRNECPLRLSLLAL